jgi:hypothetical protein
VINFLNRWRTGKDHFEQLSARQQSLRATLEDRGLEESRLEGIGLPNSRAPINQPQTRQKQGPATGSTAQQLSVLPYPSQEAADGRDR